MNMNRCPYCQGIHPSIQCPVKSLSDRGIMPLPEKNLHSQTKGKSFTPPRKKWSEQRGNSSN